MPIVRAVRGGIDPALVFDTAADDDPVDPLPLARLLREQSAAHHDHEHARAVSVPLEGPVPPPARWPICSRSRRRAPTGSRVACASMDRAGAAGSGSTWWGR